MTLISPDRAARDYRSELGDVRIEHYRDEVVRVTMGGRSVGFVETVGRLFVSLEGHRFDHAVEVHQSRSLDDAINSLVSA